MGNDLPINERTYQFAVMLVRECRRSPPQDLADRVMWQQLLKAGTSVGANSAEAPGAQSRPDWLTRRYIALKEAREAQFWLRLMGDADDVRARTLAPLLKDAGTIVAILTTIVRNAKKKKEG